MNWFKELLDESLLIERDSKKSPVSNLLTLTARTN